MRRDRLYSAISLQLFRQQYNALNMYDRHADCLDVFTLHMYHTRQASKIIIRIGIINVVCCTILCLEAQHRLAAARSYRARTHNIHFSCILCVRSSLTDAARHRLAFVWRVAATSGPDNGYWSRDRDV